MDEGEEHKQKSIPTLTIFALTREETIPRIISPKTLPELNGTIK